MTQRTVLTSTFPQRRFPSVPLWLWVAFWFFPLSGHTIISFWCYFLPLPPFLSLTVDKLIPRRLTLECKPVQQSGLKTCIEILKDWINRRKHISDANVDFSTHAAPRWLGKRRFWKVRQIRQFGNERWFPREVSEPSRGSATIRKRAAI